jgi:CCR4-NOT transcription complex subunit 9
MGFRQTSPWTHSQSVVFGTPYPAGSHFAGGPTFTQSYRPSDIQAHVKCLTGSPNERADALCTLSVQREQISDLAIYLWDSPATITALLAEILSIYPHLVGACTSSSSAPTSLSPKLASKVCNVLALFQCIAGHDETRAQFIKANIPIYLFPFLHTTNQSRECECLKLTSLGIIGSLVKADQPDIIEYLLQNEFVPLCLRILKFGQEMSKIVAAFIIQKILSDPNGRKAICQNEEKRDTVLKVLNTVLQELAQSFSPRLAKNVVQSYDSMLKAPEVIESLAQMNIPLLTSQTVSTSWDESFQQFIERLKTLVKPPPRGTKA